MFRSNSVAASPERGGNQILPFFAPDPDQSITRQVVDRVCELVALGILQAGDRLPSLKQLADHFGVNTFSLNLAYQELHQLGVTVAEDRSGSFVAVAPKAAQIVGGISISKVVHRCRQLGLDQRSIEALFKQQLDRHFTREKSARRRPRVSKAKT